MKIKQMHEITIDEHEAFRLLCKSLQMDFVLDEGADYFVKKDEYGENSVYISGDGISCKIDDRGDLFTALRNVAVNIFPNLGFRNAEYIYAK